ncbi:Histone chaperone domain CHZ [Arabidopsis thaliana x Arabidopsis arenosa]|uniref:Histone chaperone domain CHZ n=1 Tax=Arabidopsis thaliana x Arabidopsis arenosa TaxID=1240361 RepID=A0A8T2C4N1_9BRAS|nr:Histone chaperone domain CHZ [Arabidopsis thaliana x Arabidopsis arenosa]
MSGGAAVTAMETEERNQKSGKSNSKDTDATEMKFKILAALRSRVTYLRDKADCFMIVSVRRMLEEDMGLEKFALDVYKSFVKEKLVQCLEEAGGNNDENSQETEREDHVIPITEVAELSEEHGAKNDVRDDTGEDNTSKRVAKDIKDKRNKKALQSDIRRALRIRTSYIKANSETITIASLRRLLEEDLKLEKESLDPFKKFINKELDEVLQIPAAPKRSAESIGKNLKKKIKSTPSKKVSSEENSDLDAEGDVDNEEVAVKKTMARKGKLSKPEMIGKRKSENGKHVSGRKKAKHTETDSENDSDAGDSEKSLKTKETATDVYGKRVEHLKSVIKSCGMSVPPNIYKKAKQAPEEKREATLIEELEQILAKEGLSSDPSAIEIKEVKKRKGISKELEGIDTSNIVWNSRRKSSTSYAPPPKPKITTESESESDEPEESENEKDAEDEEEGNEKAEKGSRSKEEESNSEDDGGEESD